MSKKTLTEAKFSLVQDCIIAWPLAAGVVGAQSRK